MDFVLTVRQERKKKEKNKRRVYNKQRKYHKNKSNDHSVKYLYLIFIERFSRANVLRGYYNFFIGGFFFIFYFYNGRTAIT